MPTDRRASRNGTPESRMTGNGHVRFGGGPPQKYCPDEGQQLGGGLPNHAVLLPDLPSSLSARLQPVIREGQLDAPCSCGGRVFSSWPGGRRLVKRRPKT